jgi:hypothetical protein
MMVSYTRARAEGLGIESKGGLMQRPERIVTVGIAAIACGLTANFIGGNYKLYIKGISFHVFETMTVFIIPLTVLAVLTNITAINRLRDAKKALERREKIYVEKKVRSKIKHLHGYFYCCWFLRFYKTVISFRSADCIGTCRAAGYFSGSARYQEPVILFTTDTQHQYNRLRIEFKERSTRFGKSGTRILDQVYRTWPAC